MVKKKKISRGKDRRGDGIGEGMGWEKCRTEIR